VDIDINSGDLRYHGDSSAAAKTTISESRLSREVRRLGIPIPRPRNWQTLYLKASDSNIHVQFAYPEVVQAADMLLDLLAGVAETDDERRAVLERFMTSLRTQTPLVASTEGYILSLELADKYGLPSFLRPEFEADLRQTMIMRER
jgi:hypothetical protein